MQRITLSEVAAEELDAAYWWYESQREGLGDELLEEFVEVVRDVAGDPNRFLVVEGNMRRARLHRFPYGLFYRIAEGNMVVVGFFHGKREPIQWTKRR